MLSALSFCGDYAGDRKVTVELIEGIRSIVEANTVINSYANPSENGIYGNSGAIDMILGNKYCTGILDSWLLTGSDAAALTNPVSHFSEKHRRSLAQLIMDIIIIPGVTNSDRLNSEEASKADKLFRNSLELKNFSEAKIRDFVQLSSQVWQCLNSNEGKNFDMIGASRGFIGGGTASKFPVGASFIQLLSVYISALYGILSSRGNSSLLFQTLALSETRSMSPFGLLVGIVGFLLKLCETTASASNSIQIGGNNNIRQGRQTSASSIVFDSATESLLVDSLSFMLESCKVLTLFISSEKTSVLFDTLAALITEYWNSMESASKVLGIQGISKHMIMLMDSICILISMNNVSGSSTTSTISIAKSTFLVLKRYISLLETNGTLVLGSSGNSFSSPSVNSPGRSFIQPNSMIVNAINASTNALCTILDCCGAKMGGYVANVNGFAGNNTYMGNVDSSLDVSFEDIDLMFKIISTSLKLVDMGCSSNENNNSSEGGNDAAIRQTTDLLGKLMTLSLSASDANINHLASLVSSSPNGPGSTSALSNVVNLFVRTLANGICTDDSMLLTTVADSLGDIYMLTLERVMGETGGDECVPLSTMANCLETVYPFILKASIQCFNEGFRITEKTYGSSRTDIEKVYNALGSRIAQGLRGLLEEIIKERMELNGGVMGPIGRSFSRKFSISLKKFLSAIPKLIVEVI